MPYKDKKKQLEYQKNWMRKRREEHFKDKHCVKCGSIEKLELDHINPEEKISHNIWSWSKERREVELKKCQILCNKCHEEKTNKPRRKLTDEEITIIRKSDESHRKLGKKFNIHYTQIYKIKKKIVYKRKYA